MNPLTRGTARAGHLPADAVSVQLAAALRARGHAVDEQVGQSRFRCDLAIRAAGTDSDAGDSHYALGILVDTAAHYENRNVLERYVSRPRILDAFGWEVRQVLAKDWLHAPEAVLDEIEHALVSKSAISASRPAA